MVYVSLMGVIGSYFWRYNKESNEQNVDNFQELRENDEDKKKDGGKCCFEQ